MKNVRIKKGSIEHIDEVMKILRRTIKPFENPISTEIGHLTQSPYMVLVSCLLSLRTMDKVTGPVCKRLFAIAHTPEQIASMPLKKLEDLIRPVNFYKTKALRIKEISKQIVKEHSGKVPLTFEELLSFKGVGRKTANIVMVYGHSSTDHIAVDIHVHRIPNRLGWISTSKPEDTEERLKQIVPKKYWSQINDWLVAFGQNICLPVAPKCSICPLFVYCERRGVTKSR